MKKTWHAYILIAPLVAGCLLFTVVPFVLVLRYSFMRGSGGSAQFLGFENYMKVIGNEEFTLAFSNSMKFLVVGLPLIMVLSYVIALLMQQQATKHKLLKSVFLFPYIMPVAGTVLLEGEPLNTLNDKKLSEMRRRRIGFVFQKYQLLEEYSVWDNICLPFSIDHRKPDKEYVESLLEAFGIADKRDVHPNQLSGGQQQRVAIARAIAHRPAILLADEPTGNLDSETGLEVMRLLKLSQEKYGQTIMLITHDPDIAEWADRRIHIADGRVV